MKIQVNEHHTVEISFSNSRNIQLECDKNIVNTQINKNCIEAVYFYDGFHLALGDLFPIIDDSKQFFKITEIREIEHANSKTRFFVFNCNHPSKAFHYLAPFVAEHREDLGYSTVLLDCYVYKGGELSGLEIHGVFRLLNEHSEKLESIKNLPTCVKHNVKASEGILECTFQISEEWKQDFYTILHGSYSKTSEKARTRILNFSGLKKNGTTGKILYGDKKHREELKIRLGINFLPEEGESRISTTESL